MPAPLNLYNTLSRKAEPFAPLAAPKVGLYTCGPTVYHYAHIGNLRTYVFEDLLTRALRLAGHSLTHVCNITDVGHLTDDGDSGDDKMEKGAAREGKSVWDIAKFYTDIMGAIAGVESDARGPYAWARTSAESRVIYRESSRTQPDYDGHHIQIF